LAPDPPANAPALLPQWALLTPFVLDSPRSSAGRAAGTDQRRLRGGLEPDEGLRQRDQHAAKQRPDADRAFLADGTGTITPPGHWNQIAQGVARQEGNTLAENARMFAMLNVAMADAGIAAWDAKYTYNSWRPITAIRDAADDGNDATTADPNWTPLLVTPPFPEYVSATAPSAAPRMPCSPTCSEQPGFCRRLDGQHGVRPDLHQFLGGGRRGRHERILAASTS